MFKIALPILGVSESAVAEAFYCGQLGFRREYAYLPNPEKPDPCWMRCPRWCPLTMLDSGSELERVYGWDALRLVYPSNMVALAKGYEPSESAEECHRKVAPLREELSLTS